MVRQHVSVSKVDPRPQKPRLWWGQKRTLQRQHLHRNFLLEPLRRLLQEVNLEPHRQRHPPLVEAQAQDAEQLDQVEEGDRCQWS